MSRQVRSSSGSRFWEISISWKIFQSVTLSLVNHVVACIWVALGTTDSAGGTWWGEKYGTADADDVPYQYLTSLHWSLTQFTPASIDVRPVNSVERAVVVVVIVLGMVIFSSFVSLITSAAQLFLLRGAVNRSSVREAFRYYFC